MSSSNPLNEPVGILGAGAAGLICAHVLLQDGFTDVTLISRDKTVGGTWARERVYSGLRINNVHGEYRFSPLSMPPPENAAASGGRLSGFDLCNYLEHFADRFLVNKAKFQMEHEILNVRREAVGKWRIDVENRNTHEQQTLSFSRIVLATGGCSQPSTPSNLNREAAVKAGFGGIVIHSSEFASRLPDILAAVQPRSEKDHDDFVLVVGGAKSAQDMCTKLTTEGRRAIMVFDKPAQFTASTEPAPTFIRKSRLISVLSPHHTLDTRLERFLHNTSLGAKMIHRVFKSIEDMSYNATKVPRESPLRSPRPFFWSMPTSDEGVIHPNSFHMLVHSGAVDLIAPARALDYTDDGKGVLLSNGRIVTPKAIILATGYQSSWTKIITPNVAEDLGIDRHPPQTSLADKWKFKSLQNPPERVDDKEGIVTIYRGMVPCKNLHHKDLAIAGGLYSANPGYSNEVSAHWISSYFRGDDLKLPETIQEAILQSEERLAWSRTRFPDMYNSANESYSTTSLDFWTWPQCVDELLEDMHLPTKRSGGNWFTWPFKSIDVEEIATLTEERRARRERLAEGIP